VGRLEIGSKSGREGSITVNAGSGKSCNVRGQFMQIKQYFISETVEILGSGAVSWLVKDEDTDRRMSLGPRIPIEGCHLDRMQVWESD
jgi:hypothetical protein